MVHEPRYTPGLSTTAARAIRPAIPISISPVTEQLSWASQPTSGATSSGPIGGYAEVSMPSAIRVSAAGTTTLDFTPNSAPSSAATLDSPITPDLATA